MRAVSNRPATDSIADGVRSRTTYAVSLEMFEGPLDLLLHLVRRHELDILDIPIAFVTEKYIEYITFARSLDIEIAGEYLLMAATLAFLKSRELLPALPSEDGEASEDEEDGVDPREELIRRLIEYERFRDAGDELGNRPLFGRDVFPRGGDTGMITPEPGLAPVTLFRLAEAYNRVLDRAKIAQDHVVVIEAVTVRQRMTQLSLMLSTAPKIGFEALFLNQVWSSERELRQMLVVTLMSVLEMCKLGLIDVHQAQGSETLELERAVAVAEMSEVIADFREDDEFGDPVEPAAELAAALAGLERGPEPSSGEAELAAEVATIEAQLAGLEAGLEAELEAELETEPEAELEAELEAEPEAVELAQVFEPTEPQREPSVVAEPSLADAEAIEAAELAALEAELAELEASEAAELAALEAESTPIQSPPESGETE